MNEIWKNIDGYCGVYQISNLGNVKSLNNYHKKGEHLLKPKLTNHYYQVGLWKDRKKTYYSVHRLVANAFIPKQEGKDIINHINENKLDNRVCNLEWCDVAYNNTYGNRLEKCSKTLSKPVNQYDLDGNFIRQYKSIKEASKECGIKSEGNIVSACKGRYKQANGYIWKYQRKGGDAICQ